MLAYVLAIGVGLSSFALYMAAFFFPEVHRKNDFIWSGIGLFYALVLWIYAPQIRGGILLGQSAGVALLGWLGWQTFWLRRQTAPLDQQTPLPSAAELQAGFRYVANSGGRSQWIGQASQLFQQVKEGVQATLATTTQTKSPPPPVPNDTYIPPSLEEFGTAGQEAAQRFARVKVPELEAALDGSSLDNSSKAGASTESARATRETAASRSSSTVAGAKEKGRGRKAAAARKQEIVPEPDFVPPPANFQPQNTPTKPPNRPASGTGGMAQSLFKGFPKKKESKPVYVRKQYREAEVPEVQTAEIINSVGAETAKAATSHPSTASNLEVELVAEVVSEELVPDLLGNTPYEVTAAEIVEELLEDISAQEAGGTPSNLIDSRVEYETVELQAPPQP